MSPRLTSGYHLYWQGPWFWRWMARTKAGELKTGSSWSFLVARHRAVVASKS